MKKLISVLLAAAMLFCCAGAFAETLNGEADGFGGKIAAVVTVEDGKITALELTGDGETPAIGGAALQPLQEAIVAAGTVDGVDGVTGATWTSNGVFAAVKNALGFEEAAEEAAVSETSAAGVYQGIALVGTPRLGPGADDQNVPVYSFNVVAAYVLADEAGRILDLETDIVEIITPNHDDTLDNVFPGWPGFEWNSDDDADGKVDSVKTFDDAGYAETLSQWMTKRQKGDLYKLNSGTWQGEMDILEETFKGMTADDLQAWVAKYTSDLNGRPLHGTSSKEEDVAKWDALTADEKASMDAIAGATMSVNDAHGDLIAAITAALGSLKPVNATEDIAKIGLSVCTTPRLGPGADDQNVPVYSFNVVCAGSCLSADDKVRGLICDILEVITPNHDGADDNVFAGWPGQSYNSDSDADGKVDGVIDQTEDSFVTAVNGYTSKRALGSKYKMNSGTWVQEMSIYEKAFEGMTDEEIWAFYTKHFSTLNGRPVTADSTKDEDVALWNALSDAEKAEIDAVAGATMSLSDAHGNLIGMIVKSCADAKAGIIHIG